MFELEGVLVLALEISRYSYGTFDATQAPGSALREFPIGSFCGVHLTLLSRITSVIGSITFLSCRDVDMSDRPCTYIGFPSMAGGLVPCTTFACTLLVACHDLKNSSWALFAHVSLPQCSKPLSASRALPAMAPWLRSSKGLLQDLVLSVAAPKRDASARTFKRNNDR